MTRKLKRFKSDGDNSLKNMIDSKDPEIIYTILESIFYGIDKKLSSVECFEVESSSSIVTFKMAKVEWDGCLEKCLNDVASYEDYETCIKIQDYKKRLNTKSITTGKDI